MLPLLLCVVFVLFLLWLDRECAPQVSWTLWIPTIWMLIMSSRGLGAWFGVEADAEGSPLDRIVLTGFICLAVCLLVMRRFDWSTATRENVWLFVLVGYMLVSVLWSDTPYTSLKRWIRELGSVIMAFVVLSERDPRVAVQSILRRTIYVLIPFSLLLIKYFPEFGVAFGRWDGERMWIGVTMQKNGLGRLCLMGILFLVWTLIQEKDGRGNSGRNVRTRAADIVVGLIAVFLFKGPPKVYPATALVALCGGLTSLFVLEWMRKRRIHLGVNLLRAMVVGVIGFGCITVMLGGATVGSLSYALGRDETLTGRASVWALLVPAFERRPVLGYGFGGFWTPMTQQAVFGVNEAHSGYLDVGLGLGIVGLLITGMFLLSFSGKAQRALVHHYSWASFSICFLVAALIHNVSESSFDSFGTRPMMAILLLLAVTLRRGGSLRRATGGKKLIVLKPRNGAVLTLI